MSLSFGARSILGTRPFSQVFVTGNVRAFQTLSVPTSGGDYTKHTNKSSVYASSGVGQWKRQIRFMSDVKQFRNGKPTLEYAKKLPKTFASMTNEQVLSFSELGIPEACRECIIRDVMVVDQVEYDDAMKVFNEIAKTNREGMTAAALPFQIGLSAALVGGWASIPLVFNLQAVEWFNEKFVTAEMPPPADLETWLEVGSASWGWMEPVLGQVSFFLLCMQFARSQLHNLGIRPYFHWQAERRANHLVRKYPQYDAEFLRNYSRNDRLMEPHDMAE